MFQIPIQVPGLEKRRRSIGLLHVVAGFFLVANTGSAYKVLALNNYWALAPLYLIALGAIVYGFARKRLDPSGKYNSRLRLIQALSFLWLAVAFTQAGAGAKSIGLYLWVVIAAMLAFTERIALQEPVLRMQPQGLDFPSGFRRKTIGWDKVGDVTLRPDFLTIHFSDNGLLQFELQHALLDTEARDVQDFCRKQLNTAKAPGKL